MTGMLLADLAADGTVDPQDTLGETLPQVKLPAATASITLEELASQRSGLPRLSPGVFGLLKSGLSGVGGKNPYAGQDVDALLAAAEDAEPGDSRGKVGYSNFGMALLGQALAAKAGRPYQQLVSERLLQPLGMGQTFLDEAPSGRAAGYTAGGHRVEEWTGEGYLPAGIGPRSTASDLAKLVSATMAGTAPGADAAKPRFDGEIGYGWFTHDGITWHNGGTGGFSTYAGFDPATRQGVVVLSNTDRGVEWIGRRLLGNDAKPPGPAVPALAVTVFLLAWGALGLPAYAFRPRLRNSTWWPAPDRLRTIAAALTAVAALFAVHRIGAWLTVPPWLWAVAAGSAGAGLFALLLRWRALPLIESGKPAVRWAQFGLSVFLSALALWYLA